MKTALVKRLLGYCGKKKGLIVLSFLFAVLYAVATVLIPYFAGRAIDSLDEDYLVIINFVVCIGICALVSSLSSFILLRVNNSLTYNALEGLRNDLFAKIGKLRLATLDTEDPGKLQSLIINDCETVGDGMILFLNQFVSGIVTILVTMTIMFMIDIRIALFVLLCVPLTFFVSYIIAKKTFGSFKKQSEVRTKQTSYISETCENFTDLKSYNGFADRRNTFGRINDDYKKISVKAVFLSSITNPSTRFVNSVIYSGVALIGAFLCLGPSLTAGLLVSVLSYSNQFMKPFNDLSSVYTELTNTFACLAKMAELLDNNDVIPDEADLEPVAEDVRSKGISIEFKDVTFSYVPGKPVLKNVSFTVPAGAKAAIVGPTGCGKTTLINLLMRFYEPDSGDILINGRSISLIPRDSLRELVGFVLQDTWISEGTVMDNIRFGKPDMTEEEARSGADLTGASSFIRRLPKGYNETIDNRRSDISEGQKQLLSITRAMNSDPDVMILDEATSSVDVLTEVRIQKAVKELLAGRTGIIIAHRLSTIIDCDIIAVLDKGVLQEIGTHEELLGHKGFYSELYESYI